MFKSNININLIFFFFSYFSIGQVIDSIYLKEVGLFGRNPISEKFSVKKLTAMDIYLNPNSNADPLLAISILPSSTNTEETANPTLRGGSSDRSRVYLNGTPVLNPVRFGRDNGLGNFSLFNPEIIKNQYVYASNPPLTFGNSSAGLVEIETNDRLKDEGYQVAFALSNLGLMWNKKISKKSFFQIYGNHQIDDLFIKTNQSTLENLNSFSTSDIGLNIHLELSDNLSFNSFNYYIDENYNVTSRTFNFVHPAIAEKNRFFSVNNLDYRFGSSRIRYSTMFDYSKSSSNFGAFYSLNNNYQYYNSLSVKTKINNSFSLQYGLDSSVFFNSYQETLPIFFFSNNFNSTLYSNDEKNKFYYIEPYLYVNYNFDNNLGVSVAFRKNIFKHDFSNDFLSFQISSNYRISEKNKFILSAGNYHSYATPNFLVRNFPVLSSKQIALDYSYESKKFNLTAAIYYKNDKGDIRLNEFEKYDGINTFGAELNLEIPVHKNILFNFSNTFIDQKQFINDSKFNTALNLKYFIKSQIVYKNLKLFTTSFSYTTRPGNNYTSLSNASFNTTANDYEPTFSTPFINTFTDYHRVDFTINKILAFKKYYIIVFTSLNNIFDFKNQASVYYNNNYTKEYFDFLQRRIIYFGIQGRF